MLTWQVLSGGPARVVRLRHVQQNLAQHHLQLLDVHHGILSAHRHHRSMLYLHRQSRGSTGDGLLVQKA